jgi:hypothetical protein
VRHVKLVSVVLVVSLVVTATALEGGGDPKERFTPADQARARAMLLRLSDFNAAFRSAPSGSGGGYSYCAALDESDLTLTGRSQSPIFGATTEYVISSADVYESRSDANASWLRGASAAGQRCIRLGVRNEFRGLPVKLVSFTKMPFALRGQRTLAYRAIVSRQGVRTYLDGVAMLVGRAEVSVLYISALSPPPAGELRRLTGVVATRAQKAMRGS